MNEDRTNTTDGKTKVNILRYLRPWADHYFSYTYLANLITRNYIFCRLASDGFFPSTVVYDDSCCFFYYLQKHFDNDLIRTSASNLLKHTSFSIDVVHLKNHVGIWCQKNMNPGKNRCMYDSIPVGIWDKHCFSTRWNKHKSCRAVLLLGERLYASILSCVGWKWRLSLLLTLFHNKSLERKRIHANQIFDIVMKPPIRFSSLIVYSKQVSKIPTVNDICVAHMTDLF